MLSEILYKKSIIVAQTTVLLFMKCATLFYRIPTLSYELYCTIYCMIFGCRFNNDIQKVPVISQALQK